MGWPVILTPQSQNDLREIVSYLARDSPDRAHYIFKILFTGVESAYQVAHPGEKDHSNVDRASWISTFEEALAKAIVQVILSRQAEQASQAAGSQKE
jgi:plasmid stabilization system protein ParE